MPTSSLLRTTAALAGLCLTAPAALAQIACPQYVSGYYAGYAAFNPDYQAPQHVDMKAMTHLIYARIAPGGGSWGGAPGDIIPGNREADTNRKLGPGAPTRSIKEYLVARAHQVGTKAIIMLGGAGDEAGFRASLDPAVRARFIANLLAHMSSYDFDGVDVDFEGWLTDSDEQLLRAFITELRAAAAQHPRYAERGILITFPAGMKNINIDHVTPHDLWMVENVDQYNLMSYGAGAYGSGWSSTQHSPLTGEVSSRPISIASTIQMFEDAGASRCKIGLGIGLYGMMYKSPYTAPGQFPTEDPLNDKNWSTNDNDWNYATIVRKGYLDNGTYIWDSATQTGYRSYGPAGWAPPGSGAAPVGYLSYEDEAGIAAKGAWSSSNQPNQGAAGAIIWLVNFGSVDGVHNPMLVATQRAFLDPNAVDPGADPNPGDLPPLPPDAPKDPVPPPPPPPPAPVPSELLSYFFNPKDNDWTSGYCGSVNVSYGAGTVAGTWSIDVPMNDTITALWNARYAVPAPGQLRLQNPDYDPLIHPGQTKTVGFCADRKPSTGSGGTTGGSSDLATSSIVMANDWGSGWCANVNIANTGTAAASLWSVTLALPKGTSVVNNWGGGDIAWSQNGANLTVTAKAAWHDIAAGATRSIGICHL